MPHITINGYVNSKTWPDGTTTFSFKLDEYTRKKLAELPDGTYIEIKPKKPEYLNPQYPNTTHYMAAKDPGHQQAQQQAAVAAQAPLTF